MGKTIRFFVARKMLVTVFHLGNVLGSNTDHTHGLTQFTGKDTVLDRQL